LTLEFSSQRIDATKAIAILALSMNKKEKYHIKLAGVVMQIRDITGFYTPAESLHPKNQ